MSDRREFLKQASALAAVPLTRPSSLLSQENRAGESKFPSLEWEFANGQINIKQANARLISALYPAIGGQPAEGLVLERSQIPYSDRVGRGAAMEIHCRLGSLDGNLLLMSYDEGRLGCRLGVTNKTAHAIVLGVLSPLMTHPQKGLVSLEGHPAEWRVYVDSGGCAGKCASYALNENEGRNHAGSVSVLWSPGGNQALAIGQAEVERSLTEIIYEYGEKGKNTREYRWAHAKTPHLRLEQDATGYQLDPGETFELDLCILIFDSNPFQALTKFADAMVTFNQVRKFTNQDVWVGWMTWYNQEHHLRGAFGATGKTCCTAAITLEQCRFLVENGLDRYGVRDIEIDDGYQRNLHLGEWLEATSEFPSGMDGLSKDLQKLGMRPGVWLTPFLVTEDSPVYKEHPDWFLRNSFDWYHADLPVKGYDFDSTAPGALDWLLNVYLTFQRWGYWFFKNDFSGGLISSHGKQYYNRKQTGLMRWRWTWRKIKEALGGDGACSIQLCSGNNVGGIGIVDSVRTGEDIEPCVSDTRWEEIVDMATTGINRWWQNKRFFISDPDNLEVAEYKNYHLYRDCVDFAYKWALSFDEARVRTALVAAVGGNIVLGDRLTLLEPERINIVKKILPLYGESALPLDMFEQTIPSLWWHHVSQPWGSWEVLSVVNFGESSLVKEIALSRMGIPRDQPVVAWEIWSEKEHTNIKEGLLHVVVKPHSVKTLRITPLQRDRATLVGSSFHLTMGAMEISSLRYDADGSLRIQVSRPGNEQGVCAFWSPREGAVISLPVQTGPEGVELRVG